MNIPRAVARFGHFVNDLTFGSDLNRLRGVIHRFPNSSNEICLTFDDGPSGYSTSRILDCLGKHEVRATFFCTGLQAQKNPDLLREILSAGHQVGSHSMTHPHFHQSPVPLVYREMSRSRTVLERIGKSPVRLFRAPYGSFSWEVRPIGILLGMPYLIGWDVAPKAECAKEAADFILEETTPGSIILLHDGAADLETERSAQISRSAAQIVEIAIPKLLDKGFVFKTVGEQLARPNH